MNSVSSTRTKRHSLPEVQEVEAVENPYDELTNTISSQQQKKKTSAILPSSKKLAVIPRTVKTPPHIDRLEHIAQGLPEVQEVEADKKSFEEHTNTTPSQPQKTNTSLILPSHKKLAVIPRTVKTPHIDRLEHIASIREKHQIFTDPMDMISPHDVSEKVSKDCDDQSPTCGRPSVSGMISPTMKLVGRH